MSDALDVLSARRVQLKAGIVEEANARLVSPSLEEANFTPDDLIAMANSFGDRHGVTLAFSGADLKRRPDEYNDRPGVRPLGLASMLVKFASNPALGSTLQISKPDLAQPMIDLLLSEIAAALGAHDEVAKRRPIVDWMLRFPVRAARQP